MSVELKKFAELIDDLADVPPEHYRAIYWAIQCIQQSKEKADRLFQFAYMLNEHKTPSIRGERPPFDPYHAARYKITELDDEGWIVQYDYDGFDGNMIFSQNMGGECRDGEEPYLYVFFDVCDLPPELYYETFIAPWVEESPDYPHNFVFRANAQTLVSMATLDATKEYAQKVAVWYEKIAACIRVKAETLETEDADQTGL